MQFVHITSKVVSFILSPGAELHSKQSLLMFVTYLRWFSVSIPVLSSTR